MDGTLDGVLNRLRFVYHPMLTRGANLYGTVNYPRHR